jgi:hypothetical protein
VLNRGPDAYHEDAVLTFSAHTGSRLWSDTVNIVKGGGLGLAVSPDGQYVYVPSGGSSYGGNSGETPNGGFSEIATALSSHTDVRIRGSYDVNQVAPTGDGSALWLASEGMSGMFAPAIYVYDTASGKVTRTLHAPAHVQPVSVTLGGSNAFVAFDTPSYSTSAHPVNFVGVYGLTSGGMQMRLTHAFPSIAQVMVSPNGAGQNLDVLTSGGLYLYSLPSASTPPTAPTSTVTGPTVVIAAGWNLVDSAVASGHTAYWTGSAYATSAPSVADGEWMDAPSAANVTLPPVTQTSYAVAIAAHTWGMIGNPFPETVTVILQNGDKADTYTNDAYVMASGALTLQPGQGAWLYSASGGTYTIAPGSATVSTSAPPAPPVG